MAASSTTSPAHQIDQFIALTGSERRRDRRNPAVGAYASRGGFDDFGEILLRSERATGYMRVDWFTPDGLPTWGDGRLAVLGTQGTMELRKHVDIAGRPGTDHLFVVDKDGVEYIDCDGQPLSFFRAFAADVADRTETAMTQAHVFEVCRLALQAQAGAVRVPLAVIGVALVGLGPGSEPHVKSLRDLEGRIASAASPHTGPPRRLRPRVRSPPTTDLAAAIADPAVDAVLVLTPPASHLAIAGAASRQASTCSSKSRSR